MFPLNKALIMVLIFHKVFSTNKFYCKKGQKIKRLRGEEKCEPCDDLFYQDTNNYSQRWKQCQTCEPESFTKQKCTKVTDTICQCMDENAHFEKGSVFCTCNPGYENKDRVCKRCKEGYFSPGHDTSCTKWKDCGETGEKIRGTSTSDAICNDVPVNYSIPATTTLKQSTSFSPHHPPEGAKTQMTHSTTSTTTQDTSKLETVNGNYIGLGLLSFGIVMLFVLTGVACKLFIDIDWTKGPASQKRDSLCRQPVEESGDSKESFLTKINSEP